MLTFELQALCDSSDCTTLLAGEWSEQVCLLALRLSQDARVADDLLAVMVARHKGYRLDLLQTRVWVIASFYVNSQTFKDSLYGCFIVYMTEIGTF